MFPEPYIELQRMFQRMAFEGGLRFTEVAKTMAIVVVWLMPFYRDKEIRTLFEESLKAARTMYDQVFPDQGWPPAESWRPALDAGDPMAAPPAIALTPEMVENSIKAWSRTLDKDLESHVEPA